MRATIFTLTLIALAGGPFPALAVTPLEVTCDVDRKAFRTATGSLSGTTEVDFKFFTSLEGATPCGPADGHSVALEDLLVLKSKTDKFDGQKPRKFAAIRASIPGQCSGDPTLECLVDSDCGIDAPCEPAELCTETWMELKIPGPTTLTCDFSEGHCFVAGASTDTFCKRDTDCPGGRCAPPRRRLASVAFAQVGPVPEPPTCAPGEALTWDGSAFQCVSLPTPAPTPADISARAFNVHTSPIPIANATPTILAFDASIWDTDNIHDETASADCAMVPNRCRLTANTAGKYFVFGHVAWAPAPDGVRALQIRRTDQNGTLPIANASTKGTTDINGNLVSIATHTRLNVGDYVELKVYQNSGGTLDVLWSNRDSPEFGMVKLP